MLKRTLTGLAALMFASVASAIPTYQFSATLIADDTGLFAPGAVLLGTFTPATDIPEQADPPDPNVADYLGGPTYSFSGAFTAQSATVDPSGGVQVASRPSPEESSFRAGTKLQGGETWFLELVSQEDPFGPPPAGTGTGTGLPTGFGDLSLYFLNHLDLNFTGDTPGTASFMLTQLTVVQAIPEPGTVALLALALLAIASVRIRRVRSCW